MFDQTQQLFTILSPMIQGCELLIFKYLSILIHWMLAFKCQIAKVVISFSGQLYYYNSLWGASREAARMKLWTFKEACYSHFHDTLPIPQLFTKHFQTNLCLTQKFKTLQIESIALAFRSEFSFISISVRTDQYALNNSAQFVRITLCVLALPLRPFRYQLRYPDFSIVTQSPQFTILFIQFYVGLADNTISEILIYGTCIYPFCFLAAQFHLLYENSIREHSKPTSNNFISDILVIFSDYNQIHRGIFIKLNIKQTMQKSSDKSISVANIQNIQTPSQIKEMSTVRNNRVPSQNSQIINKRKSKSKNSISKQTLKRFEKSDKKQKIQMKLPFMKSFCLTSNKKEPREVKQYQRTIEELRQQNQQLRDQLIQLKVNQFYRFDQNKVRELVTYAETVRAQNRQLKKRIQQSQVVRDFLQRSNQKLKEQCQHLIKSLMNLKMESSFVNTRSHRVSQHDPNDSFKKLKYSRTDFGSPVNSTRKRQPKIPHNFQHLIAQNNADSQQNPQASFKADLSHQYKQNQLSKISSLGSFGGISKQLGQSIYYKNSKTQI